MSFAQSGQLFCKLACLNGQPNLRVVRFCEKVRGSSQIPADFDLFPNILFGMREGSLFVTACCRAA